MNFETSKTSDPHRFIDLKRSDRYVALSNLSIHYTLKNIQMSYKNNKFKIPGPTWNEKLELPDTSY